MRCDLHVHTVHSGMCTVPVFRRFSRESYNHPVTVRETLLARGMDLVTVTDHDSIGAAAALGRFSDFFPSVEVSAATPRGTRLHVGVYGVSERDHDALQRRRDDLAAMFAYLGERRLFFALNHPFSALTGPRHDDDFPLFERSFPAIETRNGSMTARANRHARALAGRGRKAATAGSDAHTLSPLGLTWTEVPGARDAAEYIDGLRAGRGRARGASGGYLRLTRTILEIGWHMMRETAWTRALAPLVFALPLVMAANYAREWLFAGRWARRCGLAGLPPMPAWRPRGYPVAP